MPDIHERDAIDKRAPEDLCKLCGQQLALPHEREWTTDEYSARCGTCGQYRMTFQASMSPLRGPNGNFWLRAAARQHWESTHTPLLISLDEMEGLAEEHASTSVAQNVSKLLNFFVRRSPRPGSRVAIRLNRDYTIVDARDPTELMFYLGHLSETGLIMQDPGPRSYTDPDDELRYRLTFKGWDHVLGTSASTAEHGRVFVAMWFHESVQSAYSEGIGPALQASGYKPVCMNDVFHNDDINFTILAEIRRAQFLVADITGARGGVYFEAGFAKALGRDVFFTCRQDRFQG